MTTTTHPQTGASPREFSLRRLLPRLALMLGSILLSMACVWLAVPHFTGMPLDQSLQLLLRPGAERVIFTTRSGDTFYHNPGTVRPPAENEVLEDYLVYYDANGFREPAQTADHYPIAVLGDSFTENGAVPWPDVLAAALDLPVQNLAFRGWGPLEAAAVMEQYGGKDRRWVLLGYFEGNDLSNIATSTAQLQQSGQLDIARRREADPLPALLTNPEDFYLYPLTLFLGERPVDMAFITDYLWWLNGEPEDYQNSRNMQGLEAALRDIQAAAGTDSCVGLVYIPSKIHLYFPYSYEEGKQTFVLEQGQALSLDAEGWLRFERRPQNFDQLMGRLENQRDAVAALAAALNLHFIDLTPHFKDALLESELLYHVYDSHWTEAGHRLAGEVVADYLRQHEEDCPI